MSDINRVGFFIMIVALCFIATSILIDSNNLFFACIILVLIGLYIYD